MELPQRKPNRLPGYHYGQQGCYFVTVCAKDKQKLFGAISTDREPTVRLSPYGKLVDAVLKQMQQQNSLVTLENYCIMPNHVHLLLRCTRDVTVTQPANAPIPQYVGTMKRLVNRRAGENLWQRSYHDHVVRNEPDYNRIWEYIETNPLRWTLDRYYV